MLLCKQNKLQLNNIISSCMIISLTAPSGGGKEFLKKELLLHFPILIELCWTTTRPLRPNEIHGVTREHVSREEFNLLEQHGDLALVQKLFDHSYGIRRQYLQSNSQNTLTELHIDNVIALSKEQTHLLAIALIPEKIDFLRERLQRRGTETARQIEARLEAAAEEIAKINANRNLFGLVVEFTEENESSVVERARAFLEMNINNGSQQTRKD